MFELVKCFDFDAVASWEFSGNHLALIFWFDGYRQISDIQTIVQSCAHVLLKEVALSTPYNFTGSYICCHYGKPHFSYYLLGKGGYVFGSVG